MKKIPLISVIVFIILSISFIIYQNFSSDSFGSEFVEQIRIADAEDTLDNIPENSIVVSTTGKTSREIFELREKSNMSHKQDFLTVGSMGHCSSISLGLAISKPNAKFGNGG